MSLLQLVSFGREVAEYDQGIGDYFLQTPTFEKVLSGDKSIIVGRKGAGKTALMRYHASAEDVSREAVVQIEATHATYVKIDELLGQVAPELRNLDSVFKLAWLFTTLLAVVDRITSETTIALSKNAIEVHKFAKERMGYDSRDSISAMATYAVEWVKNLKKVGVAGVIEVERGDPTPPEALIYDEVRVRELLNAAVRELNASGRRLYLYYDKLDERWDGSPLYVGFLRGLLLAAKDIKGHISGEVYPVVLLRDDIFRRITEGFQHVDHFRFEILPIKWDEESLESMLANRIRISLGQKRIDLAMNAAGHEVWNTIFVPKMPAKKKPTPISRYILERTLARPRDVVYFANMARDEAIEQQHSRIEVEDIKEAEVAYSTAKYGDLTAELTFEFPDLKHLLERVRGHHIGKDMDEWLIWAEEAITDPALGHLEWMPDEPKDLIELLYKIGFLSYTTRGGLHGGMRVVHSGVVPSTTRLFNESRLWVSPIFRKALELRG